MSNDESIIKKVRWIFFILALVTVLGLAWLGLIEWALFVGFGSALLIYWSF